MDRCIEEEDGDGDGGELVGEGGGDDSSPSATGNGGEKDTTPPTTTTTAPIHFHLEPRENCSFFMYCSNILNHLRLKFLNDFGKHVQVGHEGNMP